MGSKNFQSEYIEYLQNRNAELLKRIAQMKEMYENKIFSKDLNQRCLMSTLVDMLNVCTTLPEEIDSLFEKMLEAMSILINVLSKKSALVILGKKISKVLDPQLRESDEQENTNDSNGEDNNNSKTGRKAETVKVSPMINGHSISTEPRICLSRVSRNYFSNSKNDIQCLSPILEISSDVLSNTSNQSNDSFEDLRPSTERLNLNPGYNYISQESPKNRFKGTKIWKKCVSLTSQIQNKKDSKERQNGENTEKVRDVEEIGETHLTDPLEGPSWLYDSKQDTNSSLRSFVDIRRRRNRYAKNKDEITCIEDKVLEADNENVACNDSCPSECDNEKNSKNSNDSSGSLTDTDEEWVFSVKKQDKISKSYRTQRMSSRGSLSTTRQISSHISDSSYEGDNEENSNEKCKKARDSCGSSSSKPESTTKSTMLEKEAQVLLEDCMKSVKKGENFTRSRSNASTPKNKLGIVKELKSLTNNQELAETNSNGQRSKRKAAPTNLTEPKLSTKLRRN